MIDSKTWDFLHNLLVFYYNLFGKAFKNVSVTWNERSAISPQKFWYCSKCLSAPGVSLIMRKLMKGTLYR